ncbi:TPA: serine--tRNA ligase [Candidatus Berkelbacteria bacterium]|uniref:Serine--tRNA ligase n=1 Tax=Berkelbacteria bacterium GW2011_GWE1_39_12 TaxID=1618337 RepID=A0A0G4B3R1_9BACT|nr:MAG: seryl-tRNA synthetase, seryl-tRNA synthetase [Berkelbacteria bacterium GW2011_GWE1_39_12]HBO60420.1 serine--tRNA ligase [Candidatus Berkelbacteria bacterium]
MIDIKYARENLAEVKKAVAKRHKDIDWDTLLKLDDERKELQKSLETLRAKQNELSKSKERSDEAVEVKRMIKDLEPKLAEVEEKFKLAIIEVPNIPLDDVPDGADESKNVVIKTVGEIKRKNGKDHYELAKALDIIDIERAAKVSGNRFYYLKNQAVELEFALVRYVLDIVQKENFQPIIPPILIKEDMAWGSGHFEAINDDAYHTTQDSMVAVGTSEQSILPYYAGETLTEMPKRFVGFSTCLRREAGSYGKDVAGILRVHQFDKLEMFSFCKPEDSKKEHELIISLEEKIMQGLELPYQMLALCGGDMGLPSAKTVDIETWMPSQEKYRETHSSSNCTDFQARRLKIRYKLPVDGEKSILVHTLNGTALAIGRALIAIIENYQNDDGSIDVPKALHPYLSFTKIERK